jgi:hypothetical protein
MVIGLVLGGALLLVGGVGLDLVEERHGLACVAGISGVALIVLGAVINRFVLRNKIITTHRT